MARRLRKSKSTETCEHCNKAVQSIPHAVYTGEEFSRGKFIVLENITVLLCACGVGYELPCMAPLMEGISALPNTYQHWVFHDPSRTWKMKTVA